MAKPNLNTEEVAIANTMINLHKALSWHVACYALMVATFIVVGLISTFGHGTRTGAIIVAAVGIVCIIGTICSGVSCWRSNILLRRQFNQTNVGEIIAIIPKYRGVACRCTVVRLPHFAAEVFLSEEQRDALCKAIKQYAKHEVEVSFADQPAPT